MDISIIICTKGRPKALTECFDSIQRQSLLPLEVIIVDVSQGTQAERVCKSWRTEAPIGLKYIRAKPGLGAQRNIGVKNSKGHIIGFIDDDATLDERCLENVEVLFSQDAYLGGVGAMDEAILQIPLAKRLFWRIFMLSRFDGKGRIQHSGYPAFCNNPATDIEVECIPGVAAFFRSEVFSQFQFDENIPGPAGMDDVDFSFRVSKRYKLIQSRKARIYHKYSRKARPPLSEHTYMMIYIHHYFFHKNMQKSFLNKMAFWWSGMSDILRATYWALKERNLEPFQGLFKAYSNILRGSNGEEA